MQLHKQRGALYASMEWPFPPCEIARPLTCYLRATNAASGLGLALVAVLVGTWYYGLWRGWRYASREWTRAERRIAVAAFALMLVLPVGLIVGGASDGTARVATAIGVAGVMPVFITIGWRDQRRRERRIRARRHGESEGDR